MERTAVEWEDAMNDAQEACARKNKQIHALEKRIKELEAIEYQYVMNATMDYSYHKENLKLKTIINGIKRLCDKSE